MNGRSRHARATVASVVALVVLDMLMLAFGGVACRGGGDRRAGAPGPADRAAIERLHDLFVQAHDHGDVDRLIDLFTDDAVVAPADDATLEGKDDIAGYFEDIFDQTPSTIELDVLETEVHGDWAYERIDATLTMTHSATGEEMEVWARYLWILRRQPGGGWKIARLLANLDESGDEDEGAETHPET
jgi:uncharacterized protein (TIGR02246 family)